MNARNSMHSISQLKLSVDHFYNEFILPPLSNINSNERIDQLSQRYFNIPIALMARLILKGFLFQLSIEPDSNEEEIIKKYGKQPAKYYANISLLESLFPPNELLIALQYTIDKDPIYGPKADLLRAESGIKHEEKLEKWLQEQEISYKNEEEMRKAGWAKTPDIVILPAPIAIEGHVVKWIESKAWFGDPYLHRMHLKNQYTPYYNRFGPGAVIYWKGFVDNLDTKANREQTGIMLLCDLPNEITRIECKYFTD